MPPRKVLRNFNQNDGDGGWSSLRHAVGYLAVFSLALILIAFGYVLWTARERVTEEAVAETRSAAFLLANHVARMVEASDLVLAEAAETTARLSWDQIAGSVSIWQRMQRLSDRLTYVGDIWLHDTTGQLRLTTAGYPAPRESAADHEFFLSNRSPNPDIYVSPRLYGLTPQRPAFLLTRRLENTDAGFRGIVSVTIDPDYFSKYFASLDLRHEADIVLFRAPDLKVVARQSAEGDFGNLLPYNPQRLREAIEARSSGTVADDMSPLDGRERIYSYRRIEGLPLYMAVGVAREKILQAWWNQTRQLSALTAAVLLALLSLTAVAFRRARAEREIKSELQQRVEARTAELTAANLQLQTLYREVHHRVKNNLQVITSLLSLQASRSTDLAMKRAIQQSMDRVHSMSLVHELLYSGKELANIDFAAYLRTLSDHLLRAYDAVGRVNVEVRGSRLGFDLNTAIPLALIVNEVLSNALLHAFPDQKNGQILVTLARENGQSILTIQDNGIGVATGFDWRMGKGLGLRVLLALSKQIDASVDFDFASGTCFVLRFGGAPLTKAEARCA